MQLVSRETITQLLLNEKVQIRKLTLRLGSFDARTGQACASCDRGVHLNFASAVVIGRTERCVPISAICCLMASQRRFPFDVVLPPKTMILRCVETFEFSHVMTELLCLHRWLTWEHGVTIHCVRGLTMIEHLN